MLGTFIGQFLPLSGGSMAGSIAMGGSNISGGGTATFATFVGGLTGHASLDLLASNNLSDLANSATARTNLGLGTAAVANTGTANGDVPVIAGGVIPGTIIPTLNQNSTGAAANVTGTVAIGNGGTGATTAAAALSNIGGLSLSGGTMTGALTLNASAGMNFDADSNVVTDGNGDVDFAAVSFEFDPTLPDSLGNPAFLVYSQWTLAGSNNSTDLLVNRNVSSGSSTGKQYFADFQLENVSEAHLATTGIWTAKGFLSPNFSANTTIFVDGLNGQDSSGNGTITNPFKTPTHAASVASSGNLIFLMPGTYTSANQIVLPNGVSLKGSGVGVTILQPSSANSWVSGLAALVVFGNGSDVSDLTIDLTQSSTTNRTSCIGCNDTATGGSQQFGINPTMHRVKCVNTPSGLYYCSSASGTTTNSYLYLEDCIFVSNDRCAQWIMSHATLTVDAFRCQFLFTFLSSVTNSDNGECVFAQASPSRFFNCLLSMTDITNTSWSGLGYQCIDADNPVEIYGTHIITNFPNLPAIPLTTVAGTDPGWWAFSNTATTRIGAGCTVNPLVGDIGESLYQTLQSPAPHSYALSMVPANSTVTPWSEAENNLFEVAVDAGTLTSNTLTIVNVAVGNNNAGESVALFDCQKMRLRIKNTNVSSTSMTLAFGSTYNTAAFSVSTIAAGKRVYLDFIYDADNSKWDLTGYVSGI